MALPNGTATNLGIPRRENLKVDCASHKEEHTLLADAEVAIVGLKNREDAHATDDSSRADAADLYLLW